MKNLILGGCSFTEPNTKKWVSWSDLVEKNYSDSFNVINKARRSFSQSKIVESITDELVKNNFNVDFVIVQWSAIGRGYAATEQAFLERMYKQHQMAFAPYAHEYLIDGNLNQHDVTTVDKLVSNLFYKYSFTQIFLLKTLLVAHNIPYKMFWGWEQINSDIEKDHHDMLELIYDDNFLKFKQHGGMIEYIKQKIGKQAVIPNDFHPTSDGHQLFYNDIIKPIIDDYLKMDIK